MFSVNYKATMTKKMYQCIRALDLIQSKLGSISQYFSKPSSLFSFSSWCLMISSFLSSTYLGSVSMADSSSVYYELHFIVDNITFFFSFSHLDPEKYLWASFYPSFYNSHIPLSPGGNANHQNGKSTEGFIEEPGVPWTDVRTIESSSVNFLHDTNIDAHNIPSQ